VGGFLLGGALGEEGEVIRQSYIGGDWIEPALFREKVSRDHFIGFISREQLQKVAAATYDNAMLVQVGRKANGTNFEVFEGPEGVSTRVAQETADLIVNNNSRGERSVIMLFTGQRGKAMSQAFVQQVKERNIDLSKTKFFYLDEYWMGARAAGKWHNDPRSYKYFSKVNFIDPLNDDGKQRISQDQVYVMDGETEDIAAEIAKRDRLLAEALQEKAASAPGAQAKFDVTDAGSGSHGHLAFIEEIVKINAALAAGLAEPGNAVQARNNNKFLIQADVTDRRAAIEAILNTRRDQRAQESYKADLKEGLERVGKKAVDPAKLDILVGTLQKQRASFYIEDLSPAQQQELAQAFPEVNILNAQDMYNETVGEEELAFTTIVDNYSDFIDQIDEMTGKALTTKYGTFLNLSQRVRVAAFGPKTIDVMGEVSRIPAFDPHLPLSALLNHPDAKFVLDNEAAQKVDKEGLASTNIDLTLKTLEGKKILVVDDSENDLILTGRQIKLRGGTATPMSDAGRALEALNTQTFDGILVDVKMPNIDGIAFLQKLRERQNNTPVVLLSDIIAPADRDRLEQAGLGQTPIAEKFGLANVMDRLKEMTRPGDQAMLAHTDDLYRSIRKGEFILHLHIQTIAELKTSGAIEDTRIYLPETVDEAFQHPQRIHKIIHNLTGRELTAEQAAKMVKEDPLAATRLFEFRYPDSEQVNMVVVAPDTAAQNRTFQMRALIAENKIKTTDQSELLDEPTIRSSQRGEATGYSFLATSAEIRNKLQGAQAVTVLDQHGNTILPEELAGFDLANAHYIEYSDKSALLAATTSHAKEDQAMFSVRRNIEKLAGQIDNIPYEAGLTEAKADRIHALKVEARKLLEQAEDPDLITPQLQGIEAALAENLTRIQNIKRTVTSLGYHKSNPSDYAMMATFASGEQVPFKMFQSIETDLKKTTPEVRRKLRSGARLDTSDASGISFVSPSGRVLDKDTEVIIKNIVKYDGTMNNVSPTIGSLQPNPTGQFPAQPKYGGIDLNTANLKLQIKRDGNGIALPLQMQDVSNIKVDGFVPTIIEIKPVTNLPVLMGLNDNPAQPTAALDSQPVEKYARLE
jgi:6-phosphogluconolactonase/glucosamine-6-phosphate isomerase/deaminase/CheY-like chemotaxis protein